MHSTLMILNVFSYLFIARIILNLMKKIMRKTKKRSEIESESKGMTKGIVAGENQTRRSSNTSISPI